MIQDCFYTIQQYTSAFFFVERPKYDHRIAICVGSKGMEEIPRYYSRDKIPEEVISYKDTSRLSLSLKKLSNRSKLFLVGHGGEIALREKSSSEAIPTKPDFSSEMAARLLVQEAPQLRDVGEEMPAQLFKISLVSCRALQYGLELSRALAKEGISNQITARTLGVQFGDGGIKETLDPKPLMRYRMGRKFGECTPRHRFEGSKLLVTTYAQCPSLSQLELISYKLEEPNQFVWVPGSVKPLQQVKIFNHSSLAYESLFRALHQLGMSTPPLTLLYQELEHLKVGENLECVVETYFPATQSGADRLQVFLEYALMHSLDPNTIVNLIKAAPASLPDSWDHWIRFAVEQGVQTQMVLFLMQNLPNSVGRKWALESDTIAYAIEKSVRAVEIQALLTRVSSAGVATLTLSGLQKRYSPEIQLLLFRERALRTYSGMYQSDLDRQVASALLESLSEKQISQSFLEAILPYLRPIEIADTMEKGIIARIPESLLLVFFTTKQKIKLPPGLLLHTDSTALKQGILKCIYELPRDVGTRKRLLNLYPELRKFLPKSTERRSGKSSTRSEPRSKGKVPRSTDFS